MRERIGVRRKLNYANVMSTIAVFLVLSGGAALAAGQLGKNVVGAKQLKKNSVTKAKIKKNAVVTAKIKNQAVTAAKVKNGTLTGKQINASTLGTVPTAELANSIAPSEGWHLVGTANEPGFQNGWKNGPPGPVSPETVGFYKDREGVVHLKGVATGGAAGKVIFQLPAGYRPAANKLLAIAAVCSCGAASTGPLAILGGNTGEPPIDGGLVISGTSVFFDGIAFRAES